MKNPFRVDKPIEHPSFFVGRERLVKYIMRKMVELEHVLLYGERGTGKTSLLLYLAHPDSQIWYPEYHIPVYFNFESVTEASEADIWQALALAIAQQIKQRYPEREALSAQFLATIAEFLSISKTTPSFVMAFDRALGQLDMAGFKIHFLFDEFDQSAINPHLGDSFYSILHFLAGGNVSYIVAARTGLELIQQSYNKMRDPFFSLFLCKMLQPFRKKEVYYLIYCYFDQAGLPFYLSDKLCDESRFLYQTTGYHPLFLQALCYHLCARLDEPDWPEGAAKQEALRAFMAEAEKYFEYYWHVSFKEEQQFMKELASGQSVDSQRRRVLAYRLEDRSLAVQTDNGWQLFCSPFANWLNKQQISAKGTYQPPVRSDSAYDFVNREEELNQLVAEFTGEPYLHLYGSSGIGKTALIYELLEKRYDGHLLAYFDFNEPKCRAMSCHIERFLREIAKQFYNSILYEMPLTASLPELISKLSFDLSKESRHAVVVLDHVDQMIPETKGTARCDGLRDLCDLVLPALQEKMTSPTLYLRIIAISQSEIKELSGMGHISWKPYPLAPFSTVRHDLDTYQTLLRQAVTRWGKEPLEPDNPKANDLLKRWANQLYNLTAGHPAAMEATLNYVGRETQFAKPDVFETQHQALCQHVLAPLLERQLQASFPTLPEYQQAFRQLSVFRYLSKGVLKELLTEVKGNPDWHDVNSITDQVELLWERLTDTPLLRSHIDEQRLLSHQLTPIWRHQGNLVLRATNLALYQRLHKNARTVFEHFAFGESMYHTMLRITCFLELLYHLTQKAEFPPSEDSRHKLTQEVRGQLNRFLSLLKGEAADEGFALYLYELNYLLENDQELRNELRRVGESDILPQLMSIISTTTLPSKPEPVHHDELVYA